MLSLFIIATEKAIAHASVTALLTDFTVSHGDTTTNAWRDMLPVIWTTYRDGYVFSDFDKPTVSVQRMFYPEWWLEQVGYFNPMNLNHDTDAILFASDPAAGSSTKSDISSASASGVSLFSSVLPLAGCLLVGVVVGKYLGRKEARQEGYEAIPSVERGGNAM